MTLNIQRLHADAILPTRAHENDAGLDSNTKNSIEVWKQIAGYEGKYEVSNQGRVKSLDRIVYGKDGRRMVVKGRYLSQSPMKIGYVSASLWKNNVEDQRLVHSLVLEAFVGPRPNGMEVRHLDGKRNNNRLENLRWGTSSQNELDKQLHGRDYNLNKTHCKQGHPLQGANLVPSKLKVGARECRACSLARNFLRYHRRSFDLLKAQSDEYYEKVMKGLV